MSKSSIEYIVTVDTKKFDKQIEKVTGLRFQLSRLLFMSAAKIARRKVTVEMNIEQAKNK